MSIKPLFASAVALALLAGGPAFAAKSRSGDSLVAEQGGAAARIKAERKTCRLFDNTVSRMKRERLCLTREQWKKFDSAQ